MNIIKKKTTKKDCDIRNKIIIEIYLKSKDKKIWKRVRKKYMEEADTKICLKINSTYKSMEKTIVIQEK